ncbi:MAG: methyltransferase domain-containing protein [Candidatus Micrarchaeota archaeon]|nr:methyltransferase domain-containing protein [Candidatus Micrarchaeota archaeon]
MIKNKTAASVNQNAQWLLGKEIAVGQKSRREPLISVLRKSSLSDGIALEAIKYVVASMGATDSALAKDLLALMNRLAKSGEGLKAIEQGCKALLSSRVACLQEGRKNALSARSDLIFSQTASYLAGKSVLDLGSGDGQVGWRLKQEGYAVTLCDVMDFNTAPMSLVKYNGKTLPFESKNFDTTLLLTVLHHSENPLAVLREAMRVTKERIIVIESICFNQEHRRLNMLIDWFYNRVVHTGVFCPFNFQTPWGWEKTFAKNRLRLAPITNSDLGIDQQVVPEYHWLYALEVPK